MTTAPLITRSTDTSATNGRASGPIERAVPDATRKICPGAPRGLTRAAHEEAFNTDLLSFINA
jgi:hypothetical protein